MSERRSRNTKTINYASLDKGLSEDEDFIDYTPPVKKKKVLVKEKKNVKDARSSDKEHVKKKSPKQRPSVVERKLQREIEMALKLSVKEENDSIDELDKENKFSGFEDDEVNEKEDECFSESDTKALGISDNSVVLKSLGLCANEPLASTSSELPIKRQMKKVNFIEEEDSDDWTGGHCSESNPESDTDEDFCPSPQKKLSKKELRKKLSPKSKKPSVEDKLSKSEKLAPNKDIVTLTPANKSNKPCLNMCSKSITNTYVGATEPNVSLKSMSCTKLASPKSLPVTILNSSTKSPITSKRTLSPSSSISESGNSKNSISLVKTPFKSPSIGSNVSNGIQKSSAAKTGLRLGLSRSSNVKPLHPNVCIR